MEFTNVKHSWNMFRKKIKMRNSNEPYLMSILDCQFMITLTSSQNLDKDSSHQYSVQVQWQL
jgi:hypothetical protein